MYFFCLFPVENLNTDITFGEGFYFLIMSVCNKDLALLTIRIFFSFFTLPTLFSLCPFRCHSDFSKCLIFLHFHIKLFVLLINI